MKRAIGIMVFAGLTLGFAGSASAQASDPSAPSAAKDVICAQGTYSVPCPKVIWCSATNCGVGIVRPDGDLDIIYSSEPKMAGTQRTPWGAAGAMSFQHLLGKIMVFEWEESNQVPDPAKDLVIKDVAYVIMSSDEVNQVKSGSSR